MSEFYDFVTVAEARAWITSGLKSGALRDIRTEAANGQLRDRVVFTQDWPSLQEPLATSNRLRILSPFDPALRNRAPHSYESDDIIIIGIDSEIA